MASKARAAANAVLINFMLASPRFGLSVWLEFDRWRHLTLLSRAHVGPYSRWLVRTGGSVRQRRGTMIVTRRTQCTDPGGQAHGPTDHLVAGEGREMARSDAAAAGLRPALSCMLEPA